jgi:hypothetical protein
VYLAGRLVTRRWLRPLACPRGISRILARHGEPRLAACDPLTGQVIGASKATAVRYERDRPGELVHVDVKKLGKIPEGGGWRASGRPGSKDPLHQNRPDRL